MEFIKRCDALGLGRLDAGEAALGAGEEEVNSTWLIPLLWEQIIWTTQDPIELELSDSQRSHHKVSGPVSERFAMHLFRLSPLFYYPLFLFSPLKASPSFVSLFKTPLDKSVSSALGLDPTQLDLSFTPRFAFSSSNQREPVHWRIITHKDKLLSLLQRFPDLWLKAGIDS